ncbi:MAG TPA: class I SAM-dependent rRNA methyltransferase [Candidatus Limnocylindria bacterium]|nr:class I SAM-dependent rRNA methyltransferase [Candidatus Limnocylindria bacterium]
MNRVFLKPGRESRVIAGHPWVFAGDVDRADPAAQPGEVVQVLSSGNRFLGQALYNPNSQIVLRVLTHTDEVIDDEFIRRRVRAAVNLRRQLGNFDCCRLIFSESDLLPAVIADRYGDVLTFQCLSLGMARFQDTIIQTLVEETGVKGVWERNNVPVRLLEGMELTSGLYWGEVPDVIPINENGLIINVDVKGGQKTGYYLDQRENRAAIEPYCKDARVLDVFTHTGSFALHACKFGAREVTGVDISELAVQSAQENARINGCRMAKFVAANAFDYLRDASDRGEKYDLIILDPPPFAKNKANVEGAARGHKEINLRAMKMLNDGGVLVSNSCSYNMTTDLFRATLISAALDARVTLQFLEWRSQGRDHPVLSTAPETQYLKCVIMRVLR